MAKNLGQIITETRQIISQPDAANSQFTDGQLKIWINDGYRQIQVALRRLPITKNDYTVSSSEVTVDSPTISIEHAKIKNPDNSDQYKTLKIINLDELLQMDEDYENATTAVPDYLVRTGLLTVTLYPPPKSSVTALTTPLRTYGLELQTDLSASTDTPGLPENLHDILPNWAAFRCFEFLNNEPRLTQQITIFRGSLKNQLGISAGFSKSLNRWRFEESL